MLTLIDHFGGTFIIFALAILQITGIIWIYGLDNFSWDVEFMLNRKVTVYWRLSWALITPLIMIIIFIYNMILLENPKYGSSSFPSEYIVAGWIIFTVGISQVFIWLMWGVGSEYINSVDGRCWKKAFSPTEKWGPKNAKHREQWVQYKLDANTNRQMIVEREGHSRVQQLINSILGRYSNL